MLADERDCRQRGRFLSGAAIRPQGGASGGKMPDASGFSMLLPPPQSPGKEPLGGIVAERPNRGSHAICYCFRGNGQATDRSIAMPINWADIPWTAVGLLAALTFVSSLIGHSLTRNAFGGAIIAVIIFVAVYVFWDFYPHGLMTTLRFPTRI
jgi:hypothetical protein